MTPTNFSKTNHTHNKGWSKDLFTDLAVVVQGSTKTLYLSGVGSEDPEATDASTVRILGEGDFAEQTRIAFAKIVAVLAEHGATLNDVVRMTAYVTDSANIWTYFAVQGEALGDAPRPPHTFLQVAALAVPQMLVEVEVTAVIPA